MSISKSELLDFDKWYEKYYTVVKRTGMTYSGRNVQLAEDASQEAFLKLHDLIKKGEVRQDPKNLLVTIAKNYVLNEMDKQDKFQNEETKEPNNLHGGLVASTEDAFFDQLEADVRKRKLEYLFKALKEKKPDWHYIAIEVLYKGRSQVEVADELGLTSNAMYAKILRIRAWARKYELVFEDMARSHSDDNN